MGDPGIARATTSGAMALCSSAVCCRVACCRSRVVLTVRCVWLSSRPMGRMGLNSIHCGLLYLLTPSSAAAVQVVITGSTRGLGFHLARQFLALEDAVLVSGRTTEAAAAAAAKLRDEFPEGQVAAVGCDVSCPADVQRLVAAAVQELGGIDILVCNAAQSAPAKRPVAAMPPAELAAIAATNLGGALLCAGAALARMAVQPGGGNVFLVDGAGSFGTPTPGNAAYGATKRALVQLKDSLAAEAHEANRAKGKGRQGHLAVHIFSPGMVATDLLLRYATTRRAGDAHEQGRQCHRAMLKCAHLHTVWSGSCRQRMQLLLPSLSLQRAASTSWLKSPRWWPHGWCRASGGRTRLRAVAPGPLCCLCC